MWAGQMLPTFRDRYDLVLLDVSAETSPDRPHPEGGRVADIRIADLGDPDRSQYAQHFEGVDAVVHLAYMRRREPDPIDQYTSQRENVDMAYNVLRTAYDAGVPRLVSASSNHAADWYERDLIHERKMEVLDPYELPLSDNFYGWSKATYEHLGFMFACGVFGRKMGVVMVRIGSPTGHRPPDQFSDDLRSFKRTMGSYISPRDITQLFMKGIEAYNIENEHDIPWQVVYGISNNTRAFWSLTNARRVLGYEPEDDTEVKYADSVRKVILGRDGPERIGRVGVPRT